ncbi:CLUMA_CG003453, isoform A [Clunio marinus]|uniref:CLUMA_CG003453, isoform A n=1 Tax=Clunio marinus TaxID=568069 RepID=A0A1J1HQV6_9DIPT|nr:CLUMA_CG003453, isoform A [Clunio marinus]
MGVNCYDISYDEIVVKMKQYLKRNFIYICLATACLSLLTYLIAFSCELSSIIDTRRTTTDFVSIFLCTIYFVLFLSATILINGLATRMAMGLLVWSLIVAVLTIPELWLIMVQFWSMDSDHFMIEVVFYITRLILNCTIIIHVVPLALKWRKEKKILKQLESLASRLQLTATPVSNYGNFSNTISRSTKDIEIESTRHENGIEKVMNGTDNPGYLQSYPYLHYGSHNEFDASIFGLNPSQYIGPPPATNIAKRTQSLLDLRFIQTTTTKIVQKSKDKSDSVSLNSYDMRMHNNLNKDLRKMKGSKEQIYHTMEPPFKKSLGRNCVSLENLGVFVTEDAFSGNFPGYPVQQMYPAYFYYNNPYHHQSHYMGYPNNYLGNQNSAYFNNSSSLGNSKQSIDDFRKYRDVAL